MKLFSVVAFVVALSLVLAGARVADARVVTRSEAFGGPAFAGDAIVYVGVGADGKFGLTRVGADGAHLRLAGFPIAPVHRAPVPDDVLFEGGPVATAEVAASESVVAASAWKYFLDRYYGNSPTEQTFVLGSPAAVSAQPVTCVVDGDGVHVDVEGDSVATAGDGCRITVTNTATGERRTAGVYGGGLVRLAGRFVAYHNAAGDIEVWDLATGFVAYRIGSSLRSWDFALQEDGKVVRYRNRDECETIEWYSIAEPRSHVLATCDGEQVHGIEGDRVVLEKGGRLGVSDLAGTFTPLSVPEPPAGRVDLARGRIVYATRGCSPDTGTIYDIGIDDPPGPRVASPNCEAVPGTAAQLVRRGWELPVRCATGCRAFVRIDWRSKGRWAGTVSQRVDLNAGEGTRLTIRSPKSERPRFGKRRTLTGRAVVKVQPSGAATRTRSFTYRLTLRR